MGAFVLMLLAGSWAQSIFGFFQRLGVAGLFLLGVLDSSILFLPFGNDLLLIAMVSANPKWLAVMGYVLASALGSVVGVWLVDMLMRRAGEEGLSKFVKPKKIKKLKARLEKKTGWVVFIAAMIPPPFPFTAVYMTASALQCSRRKILIAVSGGRLIRFTIEALLAIWFGHRLVALMSSPIVEGFVYLLIAVAVVGSAFSLIKFFRSRKSFRAPSRQPATTS